MLGVCLNVISAWYVVISFFLVKERSPCVLYLTHGEVLMRTKDQQEEGISVL